MATLQEQLEQSIQKYNENAGKVHTFINGSDIETIPSNSGNKPTIAKIVKDTETTLASSMSDLTKKAEQVATDRTAVETTKSNLDEVLIKLNEKYVGGVGAEVGSIVAFPVNNLPQGYLVCDGTIIQKETFPDLVKFLTGNDTATQATLPDLRGVFVRGWDNDKGFDLGRALGSYQEDTMQSIKGTFRGGDADGNYTSGAFKYKDTLHSSIAGGGSAQVCGYSFDSSLVTRTSDETRPKNVALIYAIKAFGKIVTNGAVDLKGLVQDVLDLTQKIQESTLKIDDVESSISNGFANSKVTNGYTKLPNGLILQWGYISSGVNITRNFPIAFPTSCFAMSGTNKNTTNWSYGVGLKIISRTQFRSLVQHGDGATWIAIGY